MEDKKMDAVRSWPVPTTIKGLQCFLGFVNIYHRFIRNFSGSCRLVWSPAADEAFCLLRGYLTFAPLLKHPDPTLPFVVEVDSSEVGLGAVLSQRQGNRLKLYPCSFFSKKLSSAERNYDVGDRELLAVKLALEEWRHWLEGTKEPPH
jgi:hypothetical protein